MNHRALIEKHVKFYEDLRFKGRDADLEPSWILYPYNVLYDVVTGSHTCRTPEEVEEALAWLATEDHEDGYPVGSGSWVFMGRTAKESIIQKFSTGLVLVGSAPTASMLSELRKTGKCGDGYRWIVYSLTESFDTMGVGPCESCDKAMNLVPWEFPEQVRGR